MPDYSAMEGHTDRMHDSFPMPSYSDGSSAISDQTRSDGLSKLGRAFKMDKAMGGAAKSIEAKAASDIAGSFDQ